MSYQQLDYLADSTVPLLILLLVALPLFWKLPRPALIWLRVLVGFGLTALLARFIRKLEIVSGPGLETHNFPSTHYAAALCLLTFLVLLRPRWFAIWVVWGLAYGGLVIYQQYHTPLELLGSIFAVPVSWGIWRIGREPVAQVTAEKRNYTH